jgi:hypothetical protein
MSAKPAPPRGAVGLLDAADGICLAVAEAARWLGATPGAAAALAIDCRMGAGAWAAIARSLDTRR